MEDDNMRWILLVLVVVLMISLIPEHVSASVVDDVLQKSGEVGYYRGNTDVLAMTNLGYSKGSEVYMNEFLEKSGVVFGKNIVFVHNPYYKKLWFAFFNKTTGEYIYVEIEDEKIVKTAKENVKAEKILSNPEEWDKKMRKGIFGGNEFSIITIANVWARGASYEFMRCAEFHNHVCPGLISGYLIIKFLERELPLKKGEYYQILAVPPWCKDDAFQILLDSTVGKRRMYVKALSRDQIGMLPEKYKDIAGIYIAWNRSEGKGRAAVLSFNWNKACKMAGINRTYFKKFETYHWWYARLKLNLFLLDYVERPEEFVSKIREFEIDSKTLNRINSAGVDPLAELGIVKREIKTEGTPKSPIPAEIAVAGFAIAFVVRMMKR